MIEVARYRDGKMTARDAALKYAESLGREIGDTSTEDADVFEFQLLDGFKWYRAEMLSDGFSIKATTTTMPLT